MENGSKNAHRVILHTLRGTGSLRPVDNYLTTLSPESYRADMARFRAAGETVHAWSGKDRNGEPLTVAWSSRTQFGIQSLHVYETDGGE